MNEATKHLSLLEVTVPPTTALTVTAQVKILQMLGIISDPQLVKSSDIAIAMIPAETPASLHGLITLLRNIVTNHPKSDKSHEDELAVVLKDVSQLPDIPLTYGVFLPLCESIMTAKEKEAALHNGRKKAADNTDREAPAKKKAAPKKRGPRKK